jgi:serine/threonine protein kinase
MQQSIIGKVIDNYEITGILGKGGMGVVYRAKDMTLDRDVALKMMDASVAQDEEFLKRFKSEAKALAKLQNPNIVSVFALRETELGFCLVMEFVEGGTLSDRIRSNGAVPLQQLIPIFKQITTALDHAHQVGVIHRDIKPSNVMLTPSDVVKVTDFGLAKIQQVTGATVTMGTGGTLYYMSPEQVKGLANVDARGDIYSIGMTLYEAATGRVPFGNDATDFDIRQMIVEGKVPPPERFSGSLPKELAAIIQRSIHKDPAKRYQTCAEMCDALATVPIVQGENGKPLAPPRQQLRYVKPKSSRQPLYVTLLIGTMVLVGFLVYRQFLASSPSLISVNSVPQGANVLVNGKELGKTPLRSLTLEEGAVKLRVERSGYVPKETSLVATSGMNALWAVSLLKVEAPPPPTRAGDTARSNQTPVEKRESPIVSAEPRRVATPTIVVPAKLLLRAIPEGSVSIDGGRMARSDETVSLEVDPGARRVLFQHPVHGNKQVTVNLKPNETKRVTCYFESKVSISVSGAEWAVILRNGVATDDLAPKEITLPVGRHRISVSKNGYDVVEGERSIVVEPTLEPKEYRLSFTLTKK